jgi:hypothetical protein
MEDFKGQKRKKEFRFSADPCLGLTASQAHFQVMEVDAKQRKETMFQTTQKSIQQLPVRFFIQAKEPT